MEFLVRTRKTPFTESLPFLRLTRTLPAPGPTNITSIPISPGESANVPTVLPVAHPAMSSP